MNNIVTLDYQDDGCFNATQAVVCKRKVIDCLTAVDVRYFLNYDAKNGIFTRRVKSGKALPGKIAGSKNAFGHIQISINNRLYMAHRLAWLWVHGVWPSKFIDHINGNPSDNRILNLRDVDDFTNAQNQRICHSQSKTGFLGVHFDKRLRRFCAQINIGGKRTRIGFFDTAAEAFAAYIQAKKGHHIGFVEASTYEQRKGVLKVEALAWREAHAIPDHVPAAPSLGVQP